MSRQVQVRLIATTLIGIIMAVYGVYSGMWWITTLGIMLVPLTFMGRR
jgi:hypothetical protein